MGDRIQADVDRLDTYADRTLAGFAAVEGAVLDYESARNAYLSAPNDLHCPYLADLAAPVAATLLELQRTDVLPRAFAGALRALDASDGSVRSTGDSDRFDELVRAQVAPVGPGTDVDEIEAPDGFLSRAWDGVDALFVPDGDDVSNPLWWISLTQSTVMGALSESERHLIVRVRVTGFTARGGFIDDIALWRPGVGRVMSRLGPASTVDSIVNSRAFQGASRAAPLVFAGVGQVVEDWSDQDLTTGDRVARTGGAVIFEGGGAWAGATVGAQGGAMLGAAVGSVFPGPGTVVGGAVGGFVGGVAGGFAGSELGGWVEDQAGGYIESAGDAIDGLVDGAGDLLDGAGDLLGSIF